MLTLGAMTLKVMALSIATLSKTIPGIMTFRKTTPQQNNTLWNDTLINDTSK